MTSRRENFIEKQKANMKIVHKQVNSDMFSNQIFKKKKSVWFLVSAFDLTVFFSLITWMIMNRNEILKFIHSVKKSWDYHSIVFRAVAILSSLSDSHEDIKEKASEKELVLFLKIMSLKSVGKNLTASGRIWVTDSFIAWKRDSCSQRKLQNSQ